MRNGRFMKEKIEYIKEKFKTKEGLFDFFVGSAILGFVIVTYTKLVFGMIYTFFSFLAWEWLRLYISYLTYGALLAPIGIGISWILIETYKYLTKLKRRYIGGR